MGVFDQTSPAVAGEGLRRVFGTGEAAVEALRGVSVAFAAGTFGAIMGASGSGKSTLMHLLAGIDAPTEGTVTLAGHRLGDLPDRELSRLRRTQVGFLFQSFNLLPVLSAEENITLPLDITGARIDRPWLEELLVAVKLQDRRRHRPAELSGGQQQRVALARALVTRPAVVFADEPTGNLDSETSEEMLGLLRRAADQYGQTVVMVTHDPIAASHADRAVFLADGRVVDDRRGAAAGELLDAVKALRA
jgi:putative ABC transport system ATP-binding protein